MKTKSAPKPKSKARVTKKQNVLRKLLRSPRARAVSFAIVFAIVGTALLLLTRAVTVNRTFEAEYMTGATVVSDTTASAGKALYFATDSAASGAYDLNIGATQLTVRAKGVQCQGSPQVVVAIDGAQVQLATVSTSSWADYAVPVNIAKGSHSISVGFSGDKQVYKGKGSSVRCDRDLSVDRLTFTGDDGTTVPTPPLQPPTTSNMYWGGRVGYTDTGDAPWISSAWDRFESDAGKELSYMQFGQPFGSLDTNALNIIRARGAIPHVETLTRLPNGTSFSVTQLANGEADTYMNSFCTTAKNWSYPFVFRFLWEFNGPWQDTYYGTSNSYAYSRPADYVKAWQRFHNICDSVGATNISWNWTANWWKAGTSGVDPTPWWPGSQYVDIVGVDAYGDGYTFDQTMATSYLVLKNLAAGKMMYLETGLYEVGSGGSHVPPAGMTKAQWITDMFTKLPNYPDFKVLQWFNDTEAGRPSTQIETSPDATAAFRAGIANARYLPQAPSLAPLTKIPKP
jgi:hypothetical protein